MVTFSRLAVALATAVSVLPGSAHAQNYCPGRCTDAGPDTSKWSVYPNFNIIKRCKETMFYGFNLYDSVDDRNSHHRIAACTSFGTDFDNMAATPATARLSSSVEAAASAEVKFELGWFDEGYGLAVSGITALAKQMREYIDKGHADTTDRPFILYGRAGQASIGVYIGQGLLRQGLGQSALKTFEDNFDQLNVTSPSMAMQLCDDKSISTHIFGVVVTSNATFAPIQNAIQSWANATCLSFSGSRDFSGTVTYTSPLIDGSLANTTTPTNATTGSNTTTSARSKRAKSLALRRGDANVLQERAECRSVQAQSGTGCPELAVMCGISASDFTKYNPDLKCNDVKPKMWVCCSSGTLPDRRPKPVNGKCYAYTVQDDDNCDNLAAEYQLTRKELEGFNQKTWGFSGCDPLFAKVVLCLSEGEPPFPLAIDNAKCGPQKPGSKAPTDGSNIADMNPCPLNACCNIWGQCGVNRDFCIDTNTGPPGTAKKGTYGCISNCGVDIVKGTGNGGIKLAYFQGYGMGRKCLYQDALQIDASKYTHLHFGFGTLTPAPNFEVGVGDRLAQYQFQEFTRIQGPKRVLSFGGWAFSNDDATYRIFRDAVKPANRVKAAQSIANFINKNKLDGVDIDWEYPGAPDLPNMSDPGSEEDGPNYLAFLAVLKNLLPGKTVAIAAPASYWYLKQFPIEKISKVVDYIVYMTYDLHGQWDAHNEYSQEYCESGNCLRSQVNLTETRQSLAMITKAGVPGNKIVVGVTSYGRSFQMAEAGCWGPMCKFTGDRLTSYATPGRCTDTGGYIADAEIDEIIRGGGAKRQNSRVTTHFLDTSSNSDVLVYDNNQWVAYMSESTKAVRTKLYASLGMAGTTDWASDLQDFHDVPKPAKDWASFISLAKAGGDPKVSDLKLGKWRDGDCTSEYVKYQYNYDPDKRWKELDADSAWREIIVKWTGTDKGRLSFTQSVEQTLLAGGSMGCQYLGGGDDFCDDRWECPAGANGPDSGPAAYVIWQSLIKVHRMFHTYYDGLSDMRGGVQTTIRRMENVFAPIPEEKTNQWLNVMIDFLTIGALGAAAPFFNGVLKTLPAFAKEGSALFDNTKDTALNMIGQGTTLAKDLLQAPPVDKWTPDEQKDFSDYAAQAVFGWMNSTTLSLKKLFSGEKASLDALTEIIKDGRMLPGADADMGGKGAIDIEATARKTFFAYAIPGLWRRSKQYAFILDSGEGCNGNPASKYVSDDTAKDTSVCVDGRMYYLVAPDGDAKKCECQHNNDGGPCQTVCRDNTFSAPKGIGSLTDNDFGKLTRDDIVKGALASYEYNGGDNKVINITELGDNKQVREKLVGLDTTTPGLIQLPVCSGSRAWQAWHTGTEGGSDHYPCDIFPGKDHCGDSSFENQGSDASPSVEDCKQIIRNIEEDADTEWTHGITGHREILKFGSCAFGIERTGGTGGAVMFEVGGQDVIDIINESIKRFGSTGKVGAKGVMSCSGTTAGTHVNVEWGIY